MSGARILVVEDTPHNLELVTYLLQKAEHIVVPATTGAQALAIVHAQRVDLVLLDVHLPDTNGFEVLASLRADPGLHDLPVLAVTAYAMLGDREQALRAGFADYLTKPIDPHTFTARVETHLPHPSRLVAPATSGDLPTQGRR